MIETETNRENTHSKKNQNYLYLEFEISSRPGVPDYVRWTRWYFELDWTQISFHLRQFLFSSLINHPDMHLMYYADPKTGKRVYTLKKTCPSGGVTKSSHPARFSPDDKYSRHRVTLKKR